MVLLKDKPRSFILRWNTTRLCNYDCAFCIQGSKKAHAEYARGESKEIRWKTSLGIQKIIGEKLAGNYDSVRVYLVGGEVTILPELPELIKNILDAPYEGELSIHITSNLSAGIDYLERILSVFRNYRGAGKRVLHFSASYYKEYTTMEEVCEKLTYLNTRSVVDRTPFAKRMMNLFRRGKNTDTCSFCSSGLGFPLLSDEDYHQFLKILPVLEKQGISCHPIIIRDYPTDFSEEVRQEIAKYDDRVRNLVAETFSGEYGCFFNIQALGLILEDVPYFNPGGYYCDAGWNAITVSNLGRIYRCPNTVHLDAIGDAAEGKLDFASGLRRCTSNRCVCNYYHVITKDETICGRINEYEDLLKLMEEYREIREKCTAAEPGNRIAGEP